MNLNLTAKQAQQWQRLLALMDDNLTALVADLEASGKMTPAILTALQKRGLPQTGFPEEADRLNQQVLAVLALAQKSASLATLLATWWQVADAIVTYGTASQRETYLNQLPLMGLPALGTSRRATAAVTAMPIAGGWQLTGTVTHVINTGLARVYLILAQTPPDVPSAFLISADQPGIRITPQFDSLGLRGLALADLELEQVKVTTADRLGAVGQGLTIFQRVQAIGQLLLSAVSAGVLEHASEQTQQLSLAEQPPLTALTPLLATVRAVTLGALATAEQADEQRPFVQSAALTAWQATQQSTRQLTGVTDLIGDLAYTRHAPLMALIKDLQTLPLLIGTPAYLANLFATHTLSAPVMNFGGPAHRSEPEQLAIADLHRVVKQLKLTKDVPVNVGSITTAKRIVALGQGALEPAVLLQAQQLAKWIGAAIAVTQPLTNLEQFSIDQQIGGDAARVAPEVLINLGISGDDQYLAGMSGAHHVLSVNQDGDAPIMAASQQVFVGEVATFLDGMVAALN